MNIAIIGCGYVGTKIAQHWQHDLGFLVTATTTTKKHIPELEKVAQRVVVVKGNDPAGLQAVLQGQDTVLLSVGARNRDTYAQTYLHTAQTLVEVLQHTPSVQHLIYTGSYAVYGDRNGKQVDEETPVAPANSNGQILDDTEQVLLTASSPDRAVSILRLGGIYGAGRELVKIFRSYAGTTRPGLGEDITNWVHIDDIVAAIEFVRQHRLQGIYNLVDDAHLQSRELLDQLFEKHNLPKVLWDSSQPSVRPYNAWVSNQKIKAAGYQLIHPQMLL